MAIKPASNTSMLAGHRDPTLNSPPRRRDILAHRDIVVFDNTGANSIRDPKFRLKSCQKVVLAIILVIGWIIALIVTKSNHIDPNRVEYKGNDKALIGKIKNILKRSGFEGTKEERALEAEHLVRVRRVFLNMNKENTLFRLKKKDSKYISNTINVVNRRTIISLASKKDANDYKKGGANKYVKDAIYIDESGDVQLLKEKRLRKNKRAELQAVKELKHERAVVKHFPRTGFIRPKMTLGRADGKKSVFEERFKGDLSSTKKLFRLMMAETSVQKAIVIKSILYQLAEALKSLHEKGYVHRDIKPANILYKIIINPESETPTIEVVFTDFAQSSRNYEAKGKPGTTFYCSPGQLANGQNARGSWTHPHLAKSDDVYSLGVAMHELLEGSGLMRGVNIQGARLSRQIAKMLNVPEFQDSTSYNPFIEQVRNRNAITQVEKMNAFVNLYKSFNQNMVRNTEALDSIISDLRPESPVTVD